MFLKNESRTLKPLRFNRVEVLLYVGARSSVLFDIPVYIESGHPPVTLQKGFFIKTTSEN